MSNHIMSSADNWQYFLSKGHRFNNDIHKYETNETNMKVNFYNVTVRLHLLNEILIYQRKQKIWASFDCFYCCLLVFSTNTCGSKIKKICNEIMQIDWRIESVNPITPRNYTTLLLPLLLLLLLCYS